MKLIFEWDSAKARRNLAKHRVSFDEASTAFDDPLARIFDDPDHSNGEHREILVGHSARGPLLLVVFTEREPGRVRLISARRATRHEQSDHQDYIKA